MHSQLVQRARGTPQAGLTAPPRQSLRQGLVSARPPGAEQEPVRSPLFPAGLAALLAAGGGRAGGPQAHGAPAGGPFCSPLPSVPAGLAAGGQRWRARRMPSGAAECVAEATLAGPGPAGRLPRQGAAAAGSNQGRRRAA